MMTNAELMAAHGITEVPIEPQQSSVSERRLGEARDYSDLHLIMRAKAEARSIARHNQ
jgi:hypothetical protein